MKKVLIGLLVVAIGAAVYAAAPLGRNFYTNTGDVTVSAQYTGTWAMQDSLIVVASDSASTIVTISGIALMDPGDALYLGLQDDSAGSGTVPTLDTFLIVYSLAEKARGYVPFSFQYVKVNNAALTDTLFFRAACGGSGQNERVSIQDLVITANVQDQ